MRIYLLALFSSLILLAGCGQKGPLYLPQDPNATLGDPGVVLAMPAEVEADTDTENSVKANNTTDTTP